MKKFKIISAFFAVITALTFSSCQNEALDSDLLNIETPPPASGPALFKVDFGGQTFTASTAVAQIQGNALNVSGIRGTNGEAVSITIPGGVTTGTYTQAAQMYVPTAAGGMFYSNMSTTGGGLNGSVTITSINTVARTVSGTFNFTGHYADFTQNLPSVVFSNGVFENVPYTGEVPGTNPNPDTTKYFRAKVNGTMIDFANVSGFNLMDTYRLAGTNITNSMSISVPQTITVGTYPLGEDLTGVTAGYIPGSGLDAYYSLDGGSIVITSVSNGWIKGTFAFTGENFDGEIINVTEGSFNVQLP